MHDISIYIKQLRDELAAMDLDDLYIDSLCREAEYDIDRDMQRVIDDVQESCDQIEKQYSGLVRISVVNMGHGYEVIAMPADHVTIPEKNMLPSLLKNAKIAKDGSLYKVIPIGKKSTTSIVDAFRRGYKDSATPKTDSAKQEFRTASSKQDATRQWVTPARDIDVSQEVDALNVYIREQMDQIIDSTLSTIRRRIY